MDLAENRRLDEAFVVQNYGTRLPIAFVKGEGCYLWDSEGRRYLDFLAGIAVCTLGHSHPRLVAAIAEQAATLLHTSNYFHIGPQARTAELLVQASGLDRVLFCNSGAEANEALLKAARRWSAGRWGEGVRPTVITCLNSFHGRTLATLTATGNPKVKDGFAPLMPGFRHVPFNDLAAAEAAIDDTVCAFLVEPVQGEAGIIVADDAYLRGLRALCDERGILLLLDEVQSGVGRTGTLFAFEQYGIRPDGVSLAKGLAGGVPIGAAIFNQALSDALPAGTHGTTFGGNFLATRAAQTTLEVIADEQVLENVNDVAPYLRAELDKLVDRHELLEGVRGRGFMLAIALREEVANVLRDACAERGLVVNAVRPNALRLLPPLTIGRAQVDEAVAILDAAITSLA
ncbi:MAG: aspartate aminotransferase family protein [Armatimonadetes bacterium]|nr:aspartate aminotransferase family protein [Armatimonadota bacterium]